jgi:hypothetical protein
MRAGLLVYWLALNISLTQRVVEPQSIKNIKLLAIANAKRAETRGRKPHCFNRRTHPLRVADAPYSSRSIVVVLLIVGEEAVECADAQLAM